MNKLADKIKSLTDELAEMEGFLYFFQDKWGERYLLMNKDGFLDNFPDFEWEKTCNADYPFRLFKEINGVNFRALTNYLPDRPYKNLPDDRDSDDNKFFYKEWK